MEYITAKELKRRLGVTGQTLYNWRKSNKIKFNAVTSRTFLYDIDSLYGTPIIKPNTRKSVCYCRVSNTKQKNDLINQEKILREYMVSHGVICDESFTDIASGMNEDRKSFNAMIDSVIKGEISIVYISFKDRLTRFGYGYFERLFEKFHCKIVVVNSTKEDDFQQELLNDVVSIIHHFSMKMYSNRRAILKNTNGLLKSTKND